MKLSTITAAVALAVYAATPAGAADFPLTWSCGNAAGGYTVNLDEGGKFASVEKATGGERLKLDFVEHTGTEIRFGAAACDGSKACAAVDWDGDGVPVVYLAMKPNAVLQCSAVEE